MTTTPYSAPTPYPAPTHRPPEPAPTLAASRLLLWLPVAAVVAMSALQVHSFYVISDGAPDLDPLYGLTVMVILAVGAVLAVANLVLAAVLSCASPTSRATGSMAVAAWTAFAGGGFVASMSSGMATDPMLTVSTTAGDQIVWDVAAGVVAVVPLVVVLVVRSLRR